MGESDTAFLLEPVGDATRVIWSLDTDMRKGVPLLNMPMSTYFGFLMDSIVGTKYEEGLANLKLIMEG